MKTQKYPDQYLHVEECRSGQKWIVPIGENDPLDLTALLNQWIAKEFAGELVLDGKITNLEGEYYARIMTDKRPPESVVCWTSGGFYTAIA